MSTKLNVLKTNWDLSVIFADESKFEEEKDRIIKANYKFINKWKNRTDYLEYPQVLKTALDELEKLEATTGTTGAIGYYYGLKSALDQTNPHILARLNKIEEFAVQIANDAQFFSHKLAHVKPEIQKIFLKIP